MSCETLKGYIFFLEINIKSIITWHFCDSVRKSMMISSTRGRSKWFSIGLMTKVNNWKSLYVMLSSAINRRIISYCVAPEANVPQHHKCCHQRGSQLRVKFCIFMINSAGRSVLYCVFEYITGIWFTYLYASLLCIIMILLFNVVWIEGKLYV